MTGEGIGARSPDGVTRTRRRPRIVFVDHCARLSGAEIALLRLAPELDDCDVRVVLGEDGPLVGALQRAGVGVDVVPLQKRAGAVDRSRALGARAVRAQLSAGRYAIALARLLRQHRADIVHGNSLKACFYGSVAARVARVPFVWHARDRLAADYLPRPAALAARRLAATAPSAVIANSTETLRTLGPARRLDPAGLRVVIGDPIPGPAPEGSRSRPARPPGPVTVGMVGRIAPWKGQDVFLQAFSRAFPTGPERAVVIGAPLFGEQAYDTALRNRWGMAPWVDRVVFRGFQDDIGAELAALDVLVHASVIPEPFGMVVAEGMAAGLPVVAAAAGGPLDVVTHGTDGLLVPPGDVAALARVLRLLAADPALRERLGAAGRVRARAYAPARIADEVRQVYARLLAARA